MSSEVVAACLRRLTADSSSKSQHDQYAKYAVIQLECTKVTFGRADCNQVCMTETPLVSRKHAVLEKIDQHWNITDLGSSNGVWLNGARIPAQVPCQLQNRAIVEFGKDPKNGSDAVYRFQFYDKAKIVKQATMTTPPRNKSTNHLRDGVPQSVSSPSVIVKARVAEQVSHLQKEMELRQKAAEDQLVQIAEMLQLKEEQLQAREEELEKEGEKKSRELSSTIAEREAQMVALLAKKEKLEKELEDEQASKENLKKKLENVEVRYEEALSDCAELMHAKEVQQLEMELQNTTMKSTLRARQQELEENLVKTRESQEKLSQEKQKLKTALKAEQEHLAAERTEFAKEQADLKKKLKHLQKKTEVLEKESGEKEKLKEELENMLDTELVCSICSELFVQAVSLECSHSFCKLCIEKWAAQKEECPQCRAKMTARVRSIVLDNYIERAVSFLSEELSTARVQLVEERAAELETFNQEQARKKAAKEAPRRQPNNADRRQAEAPARPNAARQQQQQPQQAANTFNANNFYYSQYQQPYPQQQHSNFSYYNYNHGQQQRRQGSSNPFWVGRNQQTGYYH